MLDVKTVCCETLQHHVFLMRLEKLAVFRPRCDEEEGGKRDYYSDQALDDEDPVVASQSCYPQGFLRTRLTNAIPRSLPRRPSWLKDMQGTEATLVSLTIYYTAS